MTIVYQNYNHIAILGMGAEWKSALRFLLHQWVSIDCIVLLDHMPIIWYDEYKQLTWSQYMDHLHIYDLIIKSPGISPYTTPLSSYQGTIITTTQLFFDSYKGHTIAISGTKWKSTLTTVLYQTLQHAHIDCHIGGNIGIPLLDMLLWDINHTDHRLVVELSSYMLDWLQFHPDIAILVNIYPDHLDRHGGLEHYIQAKLNIITSATHSLISDQIIHTYLDHIHHLNYISFGSDTSSDYVFSNDHRSHQDSIVWDTSCYHLHGDFIYANMSSILWVCDLLHISYDHLHDVLLWFQWLRHRMQYVGYYDHIYRYDDAISTTPESTLAACIHLWDSLYTIMLGGTDRGYDFDTLLQRIEHSNVSTIILFPDTGAHISLLLSKHHKKYNLIYTSDMSQAVWFARIHTPPDKICLLSTASPSYSCRKNFEEKGDIFQQEIVK